MWISLGSLVAALGAFGAAEDAQAEAQCPLTQVDRYQYYCNSNGTVQNPAYLGAATKKRSLLQCMSACQSTAACQSYQYIKKTKHCQFFSEYLTLMAFDPYYFQPGIVSSDRNCYTRDCNLINACDQTMGQCDSVSTIPTGLSYSDATFLRYACSYGHTARTLGFTYQEYLFDVAFGVTNACEAVSACVYEFIDYYGLDGSIDVHWSIPEQVWVCRVFNDGMASPPGGYFYYQDVHVNRDRYTVKNDSVGAGFGYFTLESYQGHPQCCS